MSPCTDNWINAKYAPTDFFKMCSYFGILLWISINKLIFVFRKAQMVLSKTTIKYDKLCDVSGQLTNAYLIAMIKLQNEFNFCCNHHYYHYHHYCNRFHNKSYFEIPQTMNFYLFIKKTVAYHLYFS